MANSKISALTVKTYDQLINPATAAIPLVDNASNFAIVVDQLFTQFSNAGSGAGVYKSRTGNDVTLRSIAAASNKVSVAEGSDTVNIDVTESNLTLNNMTGPLSLAKGGTGAALVDPGSDHILFWDDSDSAIEFLRPGTSLVVNANTIDVNEPAIDLANCDNSTAQFYKDGATIRTSETYITTASNVEIGPASVEANTDGTHVVEVSINGTVYYLLARV